MLLVKSQFSKYEVVENLYSFETASSQLSLYAQEQGSDSLDRISRSNIVQRSGRSGHSLSSISLFISRIRGGGDDRRHSNVEMSMAGGVSPRVHCETDDGHDAHLRDSVMNSEGGVGYIDREGVIDQPPYPLNSRRASRDKGSKAQDQVNHTPLNSSHKWLLEESGKESNERRLSWEDRRMSPLGDHDPHSSRDARASYDLIRADSSPPFQKTAYPPSSLYHHDRAGKSRDIGSADQHKPFFSLNGDEKSGSGSGGVGGDAYVMEREHAMSESGSENLGESPDVFGFNLPNHRPRVALHTHSVSEGDEKPFPILIQLSFQ